MLPGAPLGEGIRFSYLLKTKAANGELGKRVTASAVDTVHGAMAGIEAEGARYEDVPGIGDEARINLNDGGIWVRVDNLTFSVAGYAGPPKPRLTPKTFKLKEIAAAAQAANRAWLQQTLDQRKRDGQKLAKAILANL